VEPLPRAEEQAWWTAAAAKLRDAAPALTRLTLAVPEAWLTSGAAGAARLEAARSALVARGQPRLSVVGRPVAVVAHHLFATPGQRPTDARDWRVVADLSLGEVRATMCGVTGATVRVTGTSAQPLPGGSLRTSLLTTPPAKGGPQAGEPHKDVDDLHRIMQRGRERLRVALAAASRNPAFLEVPVAGPAGTPPDRWLTARQVRELLAGRSEGLWSAMRGAAGHVAGVDLPTEVTILMTGPDREDLLSQDALRDAAAEIAPAAQVTLVTVPESAAAEGAALIAAGQVTAGVVPSRAFALPVHRITGGRAVPQSLLLGNPGDPDPLVVAGAEDQDACPVYVDVTSPQGTARLTVLAGKSLPSGRYQVGIWPGWGDATLVLRPVDGGAPLLCVLSLESTDEPAAPESE
jgi:hypothetical protein